MYFINYAVQVKNLTTPFQPIGQSSFYLLSSDYVKNVNVYFRNVLIESDVGVLMNSVENQNNLIYSFDREQMLPKSKSLIFEMYMNCEKSKESQY